MTRKLALLLVLFFAALQGHGQVPGFFGKGNQNKVKLPFLSSNSLILLPVSINGHAPVYFLLDTGVKANLLFSKAMGDSLSLSYTRRLGMVGADGLSTVWAQVSPINTLDLGAVEGRLQSLLVLEEDFLELESVIGVPVYGILGYEFFKHNAVKIDYDQAEISFYRPEALAWKSPFYRKLPMPIEEGKSYILVRVKQKQGVKLKAKLLLDTGANHGLLLNRETSPAIQLPEQLLETELGQSLGGVLYGHMGRVESLSMGGLQLLEVLTSYPEESPFSALLKASGRQGSLGAEVLGRTTLILDYPRAAFFVRKGATFYHPFTYDMSGLVVRKALTEEKRWYIGEVRAGSPADGAGILPFDEILSINEVPLAVWELEQLFKLLRSEQGREIHLELRRYFNNDPQNFSDFKASFRLKKQL